MHNANKFEIERVRKKKKQTDRDRETDSDRETEAVRDSDRETETVRERETETDPTFKCITFWVRISNQRGYDVGFKNCKREQDETVSAIDTAKSQERPLLHREPLFQPGGQCKGGDFLSTR